MAILSKRVLIVENQAGARRRLCAGLSARGYETDAVQNALLALDHIDAAHKRTAPYCCVVADSDLPDIDGLTLLEVIKSRYPSLPVILSASYDDPLVGDKARRLHAEAVLRKPIALDELTRLMVGQPEPDRVPAVDELPTPSSDAAYVFVRLARGADRAETFRRLYFLDHVVYCDAVHEEIDLVLLLSVATGGQSLSQLIEGTIAKLPGVDALTVAPLRKPRVSSAVAEFISQYERSHRAAPERGRAAGEAQVLAYALVELDGAEQESTFPTLYFTEGVVGCDATRGGVDLVLLLRAPSFAQLQRLVETRVRSAPSVVRVRLLPIIEMFRM